MASGGTMTQRMDSSLSMKDHLKVQGTGISPRPESRGADRVSSASSRPSSPSVHSSDMSPSDAYNVLQSVVTMNKALEGQIDALRLRLDVEARRHASENTKIIQDKDIALEEKERQIDDLKDSLVSRDDRIHVLVKSTGEKDRLIQEKSTELNDLKKLVKQTESYAGKLYKQVTRLREDKRHLESDTLYQEQNKEIQTLRQELKDLKEKCALMEKELERAQNIITQQSAKILQFENEKNLMARNFKEELDKASKAMRQEVERMREVMNQNYEEMRNLREQNKAMHSDVKDIKELIMRDTTPREEQEAKPAASNINMSTYLMAPTSTQVERGRGSIPQRRTLDHLNNQKVPRPHPSPSPLPRSNSRVLMNKTTRVSLRTVQGGVAKSAGQSSVVSSTGSQAGLPPIGYGLKDAPKWQSAAVPGPKRTGAGNPFRRSSSAVKK